MRLELILYSCCRNVATKELSILALNMNEDKRVFSFSLSPTVSYSCSFVRRELEDSDGGRETDCQTGNETMSLVPPAQHPVEATGCKHTQ